MNRPRTAAAAGMFVLLASALLCFWPAPGMAQASETALARLRADGKNASWDGIELGMSVVQAERRVGVTLALQRNSGGVGGGCGAFGVEVEHGTLRLSLGFPSARPGAKIESLYVRFEGYQVLAKRDELVAELKRLAPQVSYFAPRAFPDLTEAEAADPTYLLPGEAGYAVRLEPGRGLLLARRDCIG